MSWSSQSADGHHLQKTKEDEGTIHTTSTWGDADADDDDDGCQSTPTLHCCRCDDAGGVGGERRKAVVCA